MTDERGGRYFREARFFLAGDKVAAQSHILEARSLMGYMRDQLALGGPPIQVKYATLDDGTQIKATMMNGQYQAQIFAPTIIAREVSRVCRTFRSGLLSVEKVGQFTRDSGETYDALEWLYPAPIERLNNPLIPAKVAVEEFAGPDMIRVSTRPEAMVVTYGAVYACAYSGAMRQAVQLLLGMGEELVSSYDFGSVVYKYDFGFTGTHGLVRKAEYTDAAPAFWLVRMPTGGRGILAMDFPVCTGVTEDQRAAGITWIPERAVEFPADNLLGAALVSGDVIEAMPANTLDALLADHDPMYPDCGWAFSLSGHECQNVVYTVGADFRAHTKRVKVQFSVGMTDGLSTITATASDLDSAVFRGGKNSVPRFPFNLPTGLSLYPTPEAYSSPALPGNQSVSCPVHVYYAGDTEQVFRFVVDDHPGVSVESGSYFEAVRFFGEYTLEAGDYSGYSNDGSMSASYATLNGAAVNNSTLTGNGTEYDYTVTVGGGAGSVEYVLIKGGGSPSNPWTAIKLVESLSASQYSRTYYNRSTFNTLLVPFHQREGVYVLDADRNPTNTYSFSPSISLGFAGDTTWWELVVGFDAGCANGKTKIYGDPQSLPRYQQLSPTIRAYNLSLRYGGGVGISQLEGCVDYVGPAIAQPSAPSVSIPGAITWSGSLKFIGSDCTVETQFGSSGADDATNLVRAKILAIWDTTYIDQGTSMFVQGWTDAIDPSKYVVFSTVNTVDGADAITNTDYPISEMQFWGKSFVGIAN